MMDFAAAEIPVSEPNVTEASAVCEPFVVPLARGLERAPDIQPELELLLDRGDFLFREGDRKTHLYRLEAGILCVTAKRMSGPPRVVEMLFPGALLSLGFLERHIHSAMAVVPSRISVLPLEAVGELCNASAEARDRQALATEREFATRRRELVPDSNELPVRRVAAFLSAMHAMNLHEGRNPNVVPEFLKTGDVASFLGLDVDALARALADLQDRGLVSPAQDGGLLLLDVGGLEELSPPG
jgi:CRP/FNR family transcriptional regulator